MLSPVCGPSEMISALEMDAAIGKMKQASGSLTDVCNAVVRDGKIPGD